MKYGWISLHPKYLWALHYLEFKVIPVSVRSLSSLRKGEWGNMWEEMQLHEPVSREASPLCYSCSSFAFLSPSIPGVFAPQKSTQRLCTEGVQIPWQLGGGGWVKCVLGLSGTLKAFFSREMCLFMVVNSSGLYFSTIMG